MNKFIPQNFNDLLALVVVIGTILVWICAGTGAITLPDIVNGGLIATLTLIVQFYFRKAKGE
jgi:hypothetical protein